MYPACAAGAARVPHRGERRACHGLERRVELAAAGRGARSRLLPRLVPRLVAPAPAHLALHHKLWERAGLRRHSVLYRRSSSRSLTSFTAGHTHAEPDPASDDQSPHSRLWGDRATAAGPSSQESVPETSWAAAHKTVWHRLVSQKPLTFAPGERLQIGHFRPPDAPSQKDSISGRRRLGHARTSQTDSSACGRTDQTRPPTSAPHPGWWTRWSLQIPRRELARTWLLDSSRRSPQRGGAAGPGSLRQPLRQLRPPSRLNLPLDRHPNRLFLADHDHQLPAPGDAGIEEVPTEHHVVLHHHGNHDRWIL